MQLWRLCLLSKVCIEHIGRSMAQHAQGHCSTAADGQSLVGGRKADQIVAREDPQDRPSKKVLDQRMDLQTFLAMLLNRLMRRSCSR